MSESSDPPSHHRCPQCNGRVKRVLRTANDKRRWDADNWRRYRCRNESCDWRGLLPAHRHCARPRSAVSIVKRGGRAVFMLLLAGTLAWGGVHALRYMMGL